jgi:hypothetical protein
LQDGLGRPSYEIPITMETSLKPGKFFRVPEGPDDMERLWADAMPLGPAHLPDWLDAEDAAGYRLIASPAATSIFPSDDHAYHSELDELRDIGFVVDECPEGPAAHRVFIDCPPREEIWSIGLYAGPAPWALSPLPGVANPILARADVTDVPAISVADPFLVRAQGAWNLFFEVLNWRSRKGEIGLAQSADGLHWRYRQIVLAEPFHLSYPYVFEWAGEFFMVPESHQSGEVRLYRARPFPLTWEYVGALQRGPYLADPSLFRHADRWWMFVDASPEQGHDLLRLFSSPELLGPWREHPRSPIVQNDPRHARPAGRVLIGDNGPVRLAQNCLPQYGTEVFAFEVIELTADRYQERPLRREPLLGPGREPWNSGGMHHLDCQQWNEGSWIACVDGWRLPPPVL